MPSYNPTQKKILLSVLALHALFFGAVASGPLLSSKPKTKPLVVHTIQHIPPLKTTPVAKTTSAPVASRAPAPKPQAPPKPPPPKKTPAIADKKISPTKPAPKKEGPSTPPRANISDSLKKELQNSLARLEQTPQRNSRKMTTGQPLPATLRVDHSEALANETDYTQSLVHYLHQSLSLPEIGEVKIQLTLRQDGTIAKLVVIRAESLKNKSYLETNLPLLHCPPLEGFDQKKREVTFALTFCHEF